MLLAWASAVKDSSASSASSVPGTHRPLLSGDLRVIWPPDQPNLPAAARGRRRVEGGKGDRVPQAGFQSRLHRGKPGGGRLAAPRSLPLGNTPRRPTPDATDADASACKSRGRRGLAKVRACFTMSRPHPNGVVPSEAEGSCGNACERYRPHGRLPTLPHDVRPSTSQIPRRARNDIACGLWLILKQAPGMSSPDRAVPRPLTDRRGRATEKRPEAELTTLLERGMREPVRADSRTRPSRRGLRHDAGKVRRGKGWPMVAPRLKPVAAPQTALPESDQDPLCRYVRQEPPPTPQRGAPCEPSPIVADSSRPR